jgi:hypothetical protein
MGAGCARANGERKRRGHATQCAHHAARRLVRQVREQRRQRLRLLSRGDKQRRLRQVDVLLLRRTLRLALRLDGELQRFSERHCAPAATSAPRAGAPHAA